MGSNQNIAELMRNCRANQSWDSLAQYRLALFFHFRLDWMGTGIVADIIAIGRVADYLPAGVAEIFLFIVHWFAVVRINRCVEHLVRLERSRRHALMHDYISCFDKPIVQLARARVNWIVIENVGASQSVILLEQNVEALHVAAIAFCPGMIFQVRKLHLAEKLVFLLDAQLLILPDFI